MTIKKDFTFLRFGKDLIKHDLLFLLFYII